MKNRKHTIAVSGAARINNCCQDIKKIAREVGKEIARRNCILVTGATTGVPYFSALGCKEAGGFNVGFSPAESEAAHIRTYKLPMEPFDVMIYTGADYVGRNMLMTKSVDGVIIICGRMGTFHEFATAFEIKKPIAVLEGTGGTADKVRLLVAGPQRRAKRIVYEKDIKKMVGRLLDLIEKEEKISKRSIK